MPEHIVAWILGIFASCLLLLVRNYMATQKETSVRIEAKVDKINGKVDRHGEAIATLKTQGEAHEKNIGSLFRADEKLRDEIRETE